MDEPTLQAELAKLVQAEILYQKGRPPRCTYIFKHALLEDALYNALVKGKRQQFHRRIAEVLEARFPQTAETQPELLAHHFTEAGLTEKAIGYWLKAGLRSRERSADVEAIGHLTKGLALLETLDESPERDARELELLSPLGAAYIASRGYAAPEVGPVFRRARELCQRIGQPPQLFGIMLGIWEWHLVRGDLRLCVDLAAEGMEFADRLERPRHADGSVVHAGRQTMFYRADFAGARDCFATAVADYDDRERTRFWAAHTGHRCRRHPPLLSGAGPVAPGLPGPGPAGSIARCVSWPATIGHPFSLAYAVDHTGLLYQYCRLGAEVQAAPRKRSRSRPNRVLRSGIASGTLHKGAGMLLQGQLEEALPLLLQGPRCLPGHRRRADPSGPTQHPGRRLHAGRPVRGRAPGAGRRAGHRREERRPLPGGRTAPPQGRAAAGRVARPGRRRRGLLPPGHRDGPAPAEPRRGSCGPR